MIPLIKRLSKREVQGNSEGAIPRRRVLLPFIFLTPLLLFICFAWIAPMMLTIYLSFTDLNIRNLITFAVKYTIENFERIFLAKDPYIIDVLKTTIFYVVSVLSINVIYALFLSVAIAYLVRNEIISMILRISWLLPRITPGIIYALLWIWFVDPRAGLFNKLLLMIGVPEELLPGSWLLEKPYAQLLLVIVNGYVGASFGMIVYTAAIKSIPPDLINAALVDGATDFQVVRRIIIPLLKWPILFVTAWQTLSLLASYEYILMVWGAGGGGGDYAGVARAAGVMVWSLYSYSKAFTEYLYGYAAAISMVLVVIGIILILLYFKIFGFKRLMEPSRVEV